jgi:hypothetical protein
MAHNPAPRQRSKDMSKPNVPQDQLIPEEQNRKVYRMTDLFRQFSTPEELARVQGILRGLRHPIADDLATELGQPRDRRR